MHALFVHSAAAGLGFQLAMHREKQGQAHVRVSRERQKNNTD
jgi:hypothetical protein